MRAAGVARGFHAELARSVGGQEVALQHAIRHHFAIMCGHALVIEGAGAKLFFQMGSFGYLNEIGKHLRTQAVHQKRGFSIEAAAADCMNEAAQQRHRQRCFEQDRYLASFQLARAQS